MLTAEHCENHPCSCCYHPDDERRPAEQCEGVPKYLLVRHGDQDEFMVVCTDCFESDYEVQLASEGWELQEIL